MFGIDPDGHLGKIFSTLGSWPLTHLIGLYAIQQFLPQILDLPLIGQFLAAGAKASSR